MKKRDSIECDNKLTVDIKGLQALLSLGRCSAESVGESAEAVIRIGRRKLYSVEKIRSYIDRLTEE